MREYSCEVVEEKARPSISVRTRTSVQDLPDTMHYIYIEIIQHLAGMGVEPNGPTYAAHYNIDMQDLDVEIGL